MALRIKQGYYLQKFDFRWYKIYMMEMISQALIEHINLMQQLKGYIPDITQAAKKLIQTIHAGGKIFWMGNGGSAADAQHMAAELVGRFKLERPAIASIALNTDTSILTALSNDYDYSIIFARQLQALCHSNDAVIALSTSGNSSNIIKGLEVAKQKGAFTLGLTGGTQNKMSSLVDLCIAVPSTITARIQEAHHFICHNICELIENEVAEKTHPTACQQIF